MTAGKQETDAAEEDEQAQDEGERDPNEPVSREIFAMDTYMSISAYGEEADAALDEAEEEILRLDALLAAIVTTCALGIYAKLNRFNWNPWSVFSFFTALQFSLNGYVIGGILLVAIIAGMACKERFFCQFLCPMGAVFALLPQLPFSALQRDADNCIKGCQACKNKCPVDIKLEKDGFRNGECIACEQCTQVCPKANLTRWDRKLVHNEIIPVIVKAVLLLILGMWLGLTRFAI